jgi:CBS domain-containing protein
MLCEQIMKRDVKCLSEQVSAQEAAKLMRDSNIGFVPICDLGGKVIGTLTDRDLAIRLVAAGATATSPIGNFMTRGVVACRPTDELRRAETLMGQKHKSRIVCIDDRGHPVGVISLSDVAQHEEAVRAASTMRAVSNREMNAR